MHVALVSSRAGPLAGDQDALRIVVGPGASLVVSSVAGSVCAQSWGDRSASQPSRAASFLRPAAPRESIGVVERLTCVRESARSAS